MQREKTCPFGTPKCLGDMTIMFERSQVSGLSTCIPSQEVIVDPQFSTVHFRLQETHFLLIFMVSLEQ
jgi:hypothetical protein